VERFRRSWQLAQASWAVLRADRELLLFPLMSFIALVAIVITFAVPIGLTVGLSERQFDENSVVGIVLGFVFYVVAYTVMFFFNTALVGAAMIRLEGGDPTVNDGLRIASARLPAIVGYAIIAATVGMILRTIAERTGFIGAIIIGFIGLAWSVLTFLVVPVLVVEKVGPVSAVKRSGALLRKTWGEQIIGGTGIGVVFTLIALLAIIAGTVLAVAFATFSWQLTVLAVIATVLAVGAITLVGAALSGIYTASLYRYATTGDAGAFGTDAMTAAFKEKKAGAVAGLLGG
jgi:hypothetical protein